MTWIYAAVAVAMAGLAVLAFTAARVLSAARGLSREVERAHNRIAAQERTLRAQIADNCRRGDETTRVAAYDRA
ncbi:hypothetical protein [Nonomuraea sp. NPDC046570]|uniref:hypothetical protein n=1 Tax=Nonomuraea sp. NPDC046570 TaxID=3155255 RepID=UPI0033CCFED0